MLALGSALGCVGGISCLSSQKTARLGVYVGTSGILTGLAATLAYMHPAEIGTYGQVTPHTTHLINTPNINTPYINTPYHPPYQSASTAR